jgi:hypothetical protein
VLDPRALRRWYGVFHSFLGASVVAPGHTQVLPLPAEFITPQDGAEKQDCERAAAKRWLVRHSAGVARFRPVYLDDDLYACQPIVQAIQENGGSFILTCKPGSHQQIFRNGVMPPTRGASGWTKSTELLRIRS